MQYLKALLLSAILYLLQGAQPAVGQMNVSESDTLSSTAPKSPEADSAHLFHVQHIVLTGNNRTRPFTILRELAFKEGEHYPLNVIVDKFGESRKQLMNTGLFRDVVVSLKSMIGYDVVVSIDVKERWYIIPAPFVRTVDRSFGEWVRVQHMDLDRVNYGIRIPANNLTGRNDKLYVYFINGYTRQIALKYEGLFLDKKMQWSTNMGLSFGKDREVNYQTIDNKLIFLKDRDEYLHSFFRSFMEVSYRRAITTKHTFGIAFNFEDFADTVFALNPRFATQKKIVRYPEISYRLTHYNVDFIPYPIKGYMADVLLNKRGFNHDMNLWQVTAKGSASWPLSDKYYVNFRLAGALKMPFNQPYISQQLLGFNDMFMQGYEYYSVDGVAGGYSKATLARQIINTTIYLPGERLKRLNKLKVPTVIPLRIYAKVYGNAGYVYNPHPGPNELCNKMLYSGGFGLDVIGFYDFILKLEWSFNGVNQNGLYLHRQDYF